MSYPAPQQQPAKKNGGCVRWGVICAGIFIFVGSCSALLGGGEDSTKPAGSTQISSSAAPAALIAPEAAQGQETPQDSQGQETPQAAPLDVPKATKEQKSALRKAESYSSRMHMSKQGIYDQLTSQYGERFSPEAAQYAIDNLQANYHENALEKAKSYQDRMAMSPDAIYEQLISEYGEQFTPEEAQYAVDNLEP
ncbi:Ltp family lipoprotein [Corynebacterium hindlerae]|uniref:Ltp family lipoprotein n=1 Tax=Corynebacterium hindlerae TaxID=699041 RepID=UPI001AD7C48C|nr:Ltp family lipoprotein [Corynebacterium hindlerae]QTH60574.1 Ltp family lipoprotein [Corynebacterium hindlerae]